MGDQLIAPSRISSSGDAGLGEWNRDRFNNRRSFVSSVIDTRYCLSRVAHFSQATFYKQGVGPVTPFEVGAAMVLYFIVVITAITSSTKGSGGLTQYLIFVGVLLALRNNLMDFFLGISWERAIFFHKIVSFASLVAALIHGVPQLLGKSSAEISSETKDWTGLTMIILICMQPLIYVLLKQPAFEVFYFLHIVAYALIMVFAILHGALFVLYGFLLWGVDLLLRYVLTPRRVQLTLRTKPGDLVELSFRAPNTSGRFPFHRHQQQQQQDDSTYYRAGQYVFVMIPALGVHEWHPYTLSSAPHCSSQSKRSTRTHCSSTGKDDDDDDGGNGGNGGGNGGKVMTIHAKALGTWSRRLVNLARVGATSLDGRQKLPAHKDEEGEDEDVSPESGETTVTAFIEGPYGTSAVNIEDDTYQIVVFISGSIGVTPNQSRARELLEAHRRGRKLQKIVYVWAVRETSIGMIQTMLESGNMPKNPSSGRAPGGVDIELQASACTENRLLNRNEVLCTELYVTSTGSTNYSNSMGYSFSEPAAQSQSLQQQAKPSGSIALTNVHNNSSNSGITSDLPVDTSSVSPELLSAEVSSDLEKIREQLEPSHAAALHLGRPNFDDLFVRVKQLTLDRASTGINISTGMKQSSRVAVCVCGPEGMVASVTAACRRHTSRSEVQFDLHVEIFNL